MAADGVYQEAADLLAEAEAIEPAGPRHREQLARIAAHLQAAGSRVRVTLESDNETEVTLYRVGHLGKFLHRELDLRPGT